MKIVINTPSIKESRGGVANHFKGLYNYWNYDVTYNIIGKRNHIPGLLVLPFDLIKYVIKCLLIRPKVIVLNPSLGRTALKRDILYLKTAKLFKIKVVIFFHGWNKKVEKKINDNPEWFVRNFNKADKFLVLAKEFKVKMQEWGIDKPISLTSTKVDDSLISDFSIDKKKSSFKILFLSRVEEYKGIFTTIEAFSIAKERFPQIQLTIAGEGSALQIAKEFVKKKKISDVVFKGKISGKDLKSVFEENGIYILPTHGEGMPTSVLEAMVFGLAIITRPVGGIRDFFEVGKMGYIISDLDPKSYSNKIIELISNNEMLEKMGRFNHNYAKEHFLASKVVISLEKEFSHI